MAGDSPHSTVAGDTNKYGKKDNRYCLLWVNWSRWSSSGAITSHKMCPEVLSPMPKIGPALVSP